MKESDVARRPDNESLPTLFGRLGDDVMELFNSQLAVIQSGDQGGSKRLRAWHHDDRSWRRNRDCWICTAECGDSFRCIDPVRAGKLQPTCKLCSGFCRDRRVLRLSGRDRRAADEEPVRQAGSGAAENSCRTEKGQTMAEERTLGLARAQDYTAEEPSKEELQRRMEEARDSISNTVTEIKETVANQVQAVKDTLDWREQFKKRPVAWSAGALGVGFRTVLRCELCERAIRRLRTRRDRSLRRRVGTLYAQTMTHSASRAPRRDNGNTIPVRDFFRKSPTPMLSSELKTRREILATHLCRNYQKQRRQ